MDANFPFFREPNKYEEMPSFIKIGVVEVVQMRTIPFFFLNVCQILVHLWCANQLRKTRQIWWPYITGPGNDFTSFPRPRQDPCQVTSVNAGTWKQGMNCNFYAGDKTLQQRMCIAYKYWRMPCTIRSSGNVIYKHISMENRSSSAVEHPPPQT